MNLRSSTCPLFLLAVITVSPTVLRANAISGSLAFTGVSVSMVGRNLETATMLVGLNSRTTDDGTGDFSEIPLLTSFGSFSVTKNKFSTGGGFSISNQGYGSFDATGGDIVTVTPNHLVLDLTGTYTPGGVLGGFTASPAHAAISFTQNGTSISASWTLATSTAIPEPGTLVTMGIGLCGTAVILRRKLVSAIRRRR